MGSLAALRGKLIAVDTSPFIYFIEQHPGYIERVRPFFSAVDNGEISVITSTITLTEVLVVPLRKDDAWMLDQYTQILLRSRNVSTIEVSHEIAAEAARIRSRYKFKTPDALQLATAVVGGADAFLTNDAMFARVAPLEILFVDDLAADA
jgi:predicted nucleic acid-binding protein